jgi:hypothetical protein
MSKEERDKAIHDFMTAMNREGCAVVVWTPEELGEAIIESIEEIMIERGWEYIREHNPGTD